MIMKNRKDNGQKSGAKMQGESMRRMLLTVITAAALFWSYSVIWGSDWSNPQPQSADDKAGQLVLKCCGTLDAATTSVVEDIYNAGTGKINLLKSNFAGAAAPSGPNTGQSWYDTTNKLFKIYDGTWGGGGIYSSGTFSWSGPVITSGTATHSGTETFTGPVITTGTNTHSGQNTFSGGVVTTGAGTHSGTETFTGPTTFSGLTSSGTITGIATGLALIGEASATSASSPVTLNLGTVTAGDRIFITTIANGSLLADNSKYAIVGMTINSGTATYKFGYAGLELNITEVGTSGIVNNKNICVSGVLQVTGSGTLTMQGYVTQSGFTLSSVQMYAFFLKRQ